MGTGNVIESIKKIKRKIPFIQVPCEIIYIARHHGMGAVYDLLFWSKPRAMRKMELEEITEDIRFSIVVPMYNTQISFLRELIQGVKDQIGRAHV